ncbi:hypothetical protein CDD81_3140 [Ophiocordyceps australis]|uniref:ribonuclease T2 n=1 Tax=Ophiocordyceps australis TaxID=1399860 RepID=A0A2C5XWL2_9HYPO|nr:hypothetical protein CDD81_3140 [Ophiocordyceps australis]
MAQRLVVVGSVLVMMMRARAAQTCPSNSPLSCHNTSAVVDTCCFLPSGQLLQTQFWDTAPATGPSDSWTVHGLWPDNCDGSFAASCDESRAYKNLSSILPDDLLSNMGVFWKDSRGDDEQFWEHEWAKHGTCISTLEPQCFPSNYKPGDEAVAFFSRTMSLFASLPTYTWLYDAGVMPLSDESYSRARMLAALKEKHGAPVTLRCKANALTEVWYHYNLRGSLQDGQLVPAAPAGLRGNCPPTLRYLPKEGGRDGGNNGGSGGNDGDQNQASRTRMPWLYSLFAMLACVCL